jgi:hypothetical protein
MIPHWHDTVRTYWPFVLMPNAVCLSNALSLSLCLSVCRTSLIPDVCHHCVAHTAEPEILADDDSRLVLDLFATGRKVDEATFLFLKRSLLVADSLQQPRYLHATHHMCSVLCAILGSCRDISQKRHLCSDTRHWRFRSTIALGSRCFRHGTHSCRKSKCVSYADSRLCVSIVGLESTKSCQWRDCRFESNG